jgi:hypothetical protein
VKDPRYPGLDLPPEELRTPAQTARLERLRKQHAESYAEEQRQQQRAAFDRRVDATRRANPTPMANQAVHSVDAFRAAFGELADKAGVPEPQRDIYSTAHEMAERFGLDHGQVEASLEQRERYGSGHALKSVPPPGVEATAPTA